MKLSFYRYSLLTLSLLSGCGYQMQHGLNSGRESSLKTLSIAPILGDEDGLLFSSLHRELTTRGQGLRVSPSGNYALEVVLIGQKTQDIGFSNELLPVADSTKTTRSLSPIEQRLSQIVEVSLRDKRSQQVVLGPIKLAAALEYDFEQYLSQITEKRGLNTTSLGQINDSDTTSDLVIEPLQQQTARKIVTYLNHFGTP